MCLWMQADSEWVIRRLFEAFQQAGGWIDDGDSGARFYVEGRLQAYIKLQGGPASTSGSYHGDFRRAGGIRRAMSQTALKHGCTAYGMMGRGLYPLEAHLGKSSGEQTGWLRQGRAGPYRAAQRSTAQHRTAQYSTGQGDRAGQAGRGATGDGDCQARSQDTQAVRDGELLRWGLFGMFRDRDATVVFKLHALARSEHTGALAQASGQCRTPTQSAILTIAASLPRPGAVLVSNAASHPAQCHPP